MARLAMPEKLRGMGTDDTDRLPSVEGEANHGALAALDRLILIEQLRNDSSDESASRIARWQNTAHEMRRPS